MKQAPSILLRLSTLVLIQVLFIFVALALILFVPQPSRTVQEQVLALENRVVRAAEAATIVAEGQSGRSALVDAEFSDISELQWATVIHFREGAEFRKQDGYLYVLDVDSAHSDAALSLTATQFDYDMLAMVAGGPEGAHLSTPEGSTLSIYYHRLAGRVSSDPPAVLVAAFNHGLVVSERSRLQYAIMILFLFATLISLLTVYLGSNRFKIPLDRLVHGLEKTTEGELFYLMQTAGEPDLDRLVAAFNKMSQTLFDNQQRLKENNEQIQRANASLTESQLFLTHLIDHSPFGVIVTNDAGEIIIFNRAAVDVFGHATEEIIGQSMERLLVDQVPTRESGKIPLPQPDLEVICRRKDGEHFPACIITQPLSPEQEQLTGDLYIIRDISESKNFQNMMIRLDRYYTRGEMAGDIAHEINNYLAVLMGNLELMPLLLKKGNTDKLATKLEVMRQTVDRVACFANGLMDSTHDEVEFELSSLNQIVENVVTFLKPQNKFNSIQIQVDLDTSLPPVRLDPGQIQQLLVNLLYNAADALTEKKGEKRVVIRTALGERDGEERALVEVADNGDGVPESRRDKLFVERFTTKRKGHGIGLVTCRRLLDNHQGRIEYIDDHGAVFRFELPFNPGRERGSVDEEAVVSEPIVPA